KSAPVRSANRRPARRAAGQTKLPDIYCGVPELRSLSSATAAPWRTALAARKDTLVSSTPHDHRMGSASRQMSRISSIRSLCETSIAHIGNSGPLDRQPILYIDQAFLIEACSVVNSPGPI